MQGNMAPVDRYCYVRTALVSHLPRRAERSEAFANIKFDHKQYLDKALLDVVACRPAYYTYALKALETADTRLGV